MSLIEIFLKYLKFIFFIIPFYIILINITDIYAAPKGIKSALLINLTTGKTLYQRNPDLPVAPASLAKLMTMFLAFDAIKAKKLNLNQKIKITAADAKTGGSAMHINPGDNVPVIRLLSGMAVSSGNDAAMALARHMGGTIDKFIAQMNIKAAKLGMKSTKFKNPTGLPAAGQKTTARDLARLCREYLRQYPNSLRFHGMKYFIHKGMSARNTNPLLGKIAGVDGLKTGWTVASGYNLIVTAKRGKTRLLAIVLGGQSKEARDKAATDLIELGFKFSRSPQEAQKAINSY